MAFRDENWTCFTYEKRTPHNYIFIFKTEIDEQ